MNEFLVGNRRWTGHIIYNLCTLIRTCIYVDIHVSRPTFDVASSRCIGCSIKRVVAKFVGIIDQKVVCFNRAVVTHLCEMLVMEHPIEHPMMAILVVERVIHEINLIRDGMHVRIFKRIFCVECAQMCLSIDDGIAR